MKDEQARLEENKQRAAEGKPQIPGMAKREGAADISPEGALPGNLLWTDFDSRLMTFNSSQLTTLLREHQTTLVMPTPPPRTPSNRLLYAVFILFHGVLKSLTLASRFSGIPLSFKPTRNVKQLQFNSHNASNEPYG